jgi:hypothetical protein
MVHRRGLQIHRETLRALTAAALGNVRGAGGNTEVDTQPRSNMWTGKYALAICTNV